MGITTQTLRARVADPAWVWVSAVTIPLMLLAPALWNGYPLLQWDTGGYLARWYEGYLVPSRSTVFGLYLHYGEDSGFWLNLGIQALATLWILQLTLRVLGMARPLRLIWLCIALILTTALPWLASMLLTDIFAGLSVLALFILVLHGERISGIEKFLLFAFTAFAAATHSATLGVLFGLCCAGWIVRPLLRRRIAIAGLVQGSLTIVAGAAMLLAANFALSGQLAWTPGGAGVAFGRMLQDGIVARYLRDHCPRQNFKLCPYRNELPPTADDFLWGNSMFNTLGRFAGHERRDGLHRAAFARRLSALAGRGRHRRHRRADGARGDRRRHQRLDPAHLRHHRALHPGAGRADARGAAAALGISISRAINWIHVPVALASLLAVFAMVGRAAWRRRLDDLTLLAATVSLAMLGNAVICGVISGPHDRYGARMVWIATFTVLIAAIRRFAGDDEPAADSIPL